MWRNKRQNWFLPSRKQMLQIQPSFEKQHITHRHRCNGHYVPGSISTSVSTGNCVSDTRVSKHHFPPGDATVTQLQAAAATVRTTALIAMTSEFRWPQCSFCKNTEKSICILLKWEFGKCYLLHWPPLKVSSCVSRKTTEVPLDDTVALIIHNDLQQ